MDSRHFLVSMTHLIDELDNASFESKLSVEIRIWPIRTIYYSFMSFWQNARGTKAVVTSQLNPVAASRPNPFESLLGLNYPVVSAWKTKDMEAKRFESSYFRGTKCSPILIGWSVN